jgi:MSHA biogenesis protein MshQ
MRTFALCLVACMLWAQPASAQIAFGTLGGSIAGSTSLAVPVPASIAAGDLLVMCISNKYPANGPATPAGWTLPSNGQASGGSGSAGADTGTVYATVFVKIADGTETTTTVTLTGANSSGAKMVRYTKTLSTWDYVTVNGADNAGAGNWSVTAGADPGVASGDFIVTCSAINTDLYTYNTQAMSQTGITFGAAVERNEIGTTLGDDSHLVISEHPVTAGTSSAAPVYTMTASGSATDNPAGATVILRLRETSGSTCTGGLLLLGAGKCE